MAPLQQESRDGCCSNECLEQIMQGVHPNVPAEEQLKDPYENIKEHNFDPNTFDLTVAERFDDERFCQGYYVRCVNQVIARSQPRTLLSLKEKKYALEEKRSEYGGRVFGTAVGHWSDWERQIEET